MSEVNEEVNNVIVVEEKEVVKEEEKEEYKQKVAKKTKKRKAEDDYIKVQGVVLCEEAGQLQLHEMSGFEDAMRLCFGKEGRLWVDKLKLNEKDQYVEDGEVMYEMKKCQDRWGFDETILFFPNKDIYLDLMERLEMEFQEELMTGVEVGFVEEMNVRLSMNGPRSTAFANLLKNLKSIYNGEKVLDEDADDLLDLKEEDAEDEDMKVMAAYGLYCEMLFWILKKNIIFFLFFFQ